MSGKLSQRHTEVMSAHENLQQQALSVSYYCIVHSSALLQGTRGEGCAGGLEVGEGGPHDNEHRSHRGKESREKQKP